MTIDPDLNGAWIELARLRSESDKYLADIERFRAMARGYMDERDDLKEHLRAIQKMVNDQAEDGAIWDEPLGGRPAPEAYVVQELRRLHAAVEDGAVAWDRHGNPMAWKESN